jgi:hypothetical protein
MTSQCGRAGNEATNEASSAVFDTPAIRSKPTGEKQYDEDDQDNTDDAIYKTSKLYIIISLNY